MNIDVLIIGKSRTEKLRAAAQTNMELQSFMPPDNSFIQPSFLSTILSQSIGSPHNNGCLSGFSSRIQCVSNLTD